MNSIACKLISCPGARLTLVSFRDCQSGNETRLASCSRPSNFTPIAVAVSWQWKFNSAIHVGTVVVLVKSRLSGSVQASASSRTC